MILHCTICEGDFVCIVWVVTYLKVILWFCLRWCLGGGEDGERQAKTGVGGATGENQEWVLPNTTVKLWIFSF